MFKNIQEQARVHVTLVLALIALQLLMTGVVIADRELYLNFEGVKHLALLVVHMATMSGCIFLLMNADITHDSPKPNSMLAILGMVGFLISTMNLIGSVIAIVSQAKLMESTVLIQFGLASAIAIGFALFFMHYQMAFKLGINRRLQQLKLLVGTLHAQRINTHNAADLIKRVEAAEDRTSFQSELEETIKTLSQIQKMEGARQ